MKLDSSNQQKKNNNKRLGLSKPFTALSALMTRATINRIKAPSIHLKHKWNLSEASVNQISRFTEPILTKERANPLSVHIKGNQNKENSTWSPLDMTLPNGIHTDTSGTLFPQATGLSEYSSGQVIEPFSLPEITPVFPKTNPVPEKSSSPAKWKKPDATARRHIQIEEVQTGKPSSISTPVEKKMQMPQQSIQPETGLESISNEISTAHTQVKSQIQRKPLVSTPAATPVHQQTIVTGDVREEPNASVREETNTTPASISETPSPVLLRPISPAVESNHPREKRRQEFFTPVNKILSASTSKSKESEETLVKSPSSIIEPILSQLGNRHSPSPEGKLPIQHAADQTSNVQPVKAVVSSKESGQVTFPVRQSEPPEIVKLTQQKNTGIQTLHQEQRLIAHEVPGEIESSPESIQEVSRTLVPISKKKTADKPALPSDLPVRRSSSVAVSKNMEPDKPLAAEEQIHSSEIAGTASAAPVPLQPLVQKKSSMVISHDPKATTIIRRSPELSHGNRATPVRLQSGPINLKINQVNRIQRKAASATTQPVAAQGRHITAQEVRHENHQAKWVAPVIHPIKVQESFTPGASVPAPSIPAPSIPLFDPGQSKNIQGKISPSTVGSKPLAPKPGNRSVPFSLHRETQFSTHQTSISQELWNPARSIQLTLLSPSTPGDVNPKSSLAAPSIITAIRKFNKSSSRSIHTGNNPVRENNHPSQTKPLSIHRQSNSRLPSAPGLTVLQTNGENQISGPSVSLSENRKTQSPSPAPMNMDGPALELPKHTQMPVLHRAPLESSDHLIQRSIAQNSNQEADIPASSEEALPNQNAETAETRKKNAKHIQELAAQIYPLVRRMLEIERERKTGCSY